ncbi:MAG: autotransporter-associated beta strand repeat-containing protein [Burkholderiales bacterium]|nr:autotransporter-associated beta strand repeat-containing protein [Phycisphaerae bacterium]
MRTQTISRQILLAAVAAVPLLSNHSIADSQKANNANALNLTTSWANAIVPGAADIAIWDGTVATAANGTANLGANLSWLGISVSNPAGAVNINDVTKTLTLGTSGISMGTATQNLAINTALTINGSQTWDIGQVGNIRTVTVSGPTNGTGNVTVTGVGNLNYTGLASFTGSFNFLGTGNVTLGGLTNAYTGTTTITGGQLILTNAGSLGALAAGLTATGSNVITNFALDQATLTKVNSASTSTFILGVSSANNLDLVTPGLAGIRVGGNNNSILSGTLTSAGGTYRLGGGNAGTFTISSNMVDSAALDILAAVGQTVSLTGTNSYTGATTISSAGTGGGTARFGAASFAGGGGADVTLSNNAVIARDGVTDQAFVNRLTAASVGAVAMTADTANAIDFATPGLANVSLGAIGTVNYTGTLTPSGTTYRLGGGSGTLNYNGSTITGGNSLVAGTAGSPGTVVLNSTYAYTGGTTINGGTLQLGTGGTTGMIPLDNVTLNGGTLSLNRSDNTTISMPILGTTGGVNVKTGGLTLNFAGAGAPAADILPALTALSIGQGANFSVTGSGVPVAAQQTVASTTFGSGTGILGGGLTTFTVTGDVSSTATPTINLGVISAPIGGNEAQKSGGVAVRFVGPATQDAAGAPIAATGFARTSALTNTGTAGVLGGGAVAGQASSGYATVGLYDFAGVDAADNNTIKGGSQIAGFMIPLATNGGYNTGGPAGNYDLTTQGGNVGGGNRYANTVRFNTPGVNTVNLNGSLYHVTGVLVTPNMGANNAAFSSGITGAIWDNGRNDAAQQYQNTVWQNNTGGFFNVDVQATNSRGNTGDIRPTAIVKAGAGTMVMVRPNNVYSGGTVIYEGAIMFSASDLTSGAGTGPLGNPSATAGVGVPTVRIGGGSLIGNGGNINLASTRGIGITGTAGISSTSGNKLTINGVISDAATTAQALTIGSGTVPGTGVGTANTTALTGDGTVALSAANTYTKGTVIGNGATLLAVNTTGSATGTGAVTVNSTGILGGTGTIAGSADIQNGGRLNTGVPGTLSGLGTLTTGGVSFSTGSVLDLDMSATGNDMTVSTNGLSVASGTLYNLFAAGTASPFTINGTYNIFNVTAGTIPSPATLNTNFSIANPVGGGSYLWGLSGTNVTLTISGLTTIATWANSAGSTWNSGPNWTSNPAIPDAPAASAIFGSALLASGQVTLDGNRTLGAATFNNASFSYDLAPGTGGTLNIDGGFGAALVSNVNGNHTISAPVNLVTNATFGVSNLANTLTISGAISGANLTVDSGFGTVVLTGTNTYGTTTVSSSDQLQIGNGGTTGTLGSGAVAVNGTLTFNRSDSYNVTNSISGAVGGIVTQSGTGTTTLAGTNTGSWGTRVTAGTLTVGTGSGLGTGPITTNGGTLNLNDSTVTTSLLSGTGGNVDNLTGVGAATLIIADTGDATYAGNLRNTSGTLAVNKTGSGNLTLTGNNTMTGGFDVSAGQVFLASSTALPAGSTITTRILGNGLQLRNSSDIGGTIALNPNGNTTNGLMDVTGGVTGTPNNVTLSGKITTPVALTNNGTNLRINAGNDAFNTLTVVGTGSINLPDPANLTWNGLPNFERGRWAWQDNSVLNARPNVWFGRNAGSNLTFDFRNNAAANLMGGLQLAAGGAATASVTLTMQDNATLTMGNPSTNVVYGITGPIFAGLQLNGGGTTTTTNLNGGTLWTNNITTTNTAILNLNGTLIKAEDNNAAYIAASAALTMNVLAGGAKIDTAGWNGLGKEIRIDEGFLNGVVGDGGLTKSGLGRLIIAGANTYDGASRVTGGTLQFATQASLYNNNVAQWTATNLVVDSGATAAFNVGGAGEFVSTDIDTIAALGTATGGFKNGSSIGLDATNGPTYTYSTAIVDPNAGANVRGVSILGGTVVLDGASTYTGTTLIKAPSLATATLSLGSAGAIGTTGDVTFGNGSTLQHTAANTVDYSARIKNSTSPMGIDTNGQNVNYATAMAATNTGGLTKTGLGTLTLGGVHVYTGTTTVSAGKLITTNGLKTNQPMVINGDGTTNGAVEVPINGMSAGVTLVSSLTVTPNGSNFFGTLELHDNDLIVDYGANATPYASVLAQVKAGIPLLGFGGDGTGIASAEVQAQGAGGIGLSGTMLGVIDGATTGGQVAALSGFTVPNPTTSVLVKYTWRGDANLDGVVNGSDYALADTGFSGGGTGWFYGDVNYDDVINGSDYALIDTGFSSQTGPLPEPAMLSLLGLGAMGMLRRRRRAV